MLHFLVGLAIAFFVLGPAWATCDANNVSTKRTTSFGLGPGLNSQSTLGTKMIVSSRC